MSRIRRFVRWFERPESPAPLAFFRVAVAGFCLAKLWAVRGSILDVHGQYGFVQWAITRGTLPEVLPHLGNLALWLGRFGLSADQSVYAIVAAYVTLLGFMLVGIFPRSAAAAAWFLHLTLMYGGAGLLYGMDYFTHIALFYCIIMPTGDAFSAPVMLGWRASRPSVAAGVTRKMLQIQLAIIYLSSGLEKASGLQWWNGEAIWRSLTLPIFRQFDFTWLSAVPVLAVVMGISVLLIESGYAIFMWRPGWRGLWLLLTCGLHLGIGLFMGMWVFAAIMIILGCGAFGSEALGDAARARRWIAVRRERMRHAEALA